MKKLLGILVLGLLLSSNAYAECIEGDCNNGYGIYTSADGDKYIGEWKKTKYNKQDNKRGRNGTGTYIYVNGDKYVGEWKKGLRHGKGIFTHTNGDIEKGIWKKDKLVKLKQ